MKCTYYNETGMFATTAVMERNVVASLGQRACQKPGRTPNPCLSPHCPFVLSPLSLTQNSLLFRVLGRGPVMDRTQSVSS